MENVLVTPQTETKPEVIIDDLFSMIPGIENATQVQVVMSNDLSEKKFNKDWVAPNKPCLIKGAVKHWPAIQHFKSEEYWLKACDDFKITIYPHMNHASWDRHKINSEELTFHKAIKRLFNNEDPILSMPAEKITDDNRFSKLINEMPGFTFHNSSIKPRLYEQKRFFLYRRASTAWHHHITDETLMCQVSGAKKVALLSPEIPNAREIVEFFRNDSYLDGEVLDSSIDLKPVIAYVEEGDALYIPPYWLHAVMPDDDVVGFTYAHCWKTPIHKFGNFSNYFVGQFYKGGLQPFRKISLVMPFLAVFSGLSYGFKKMIGRI